MMENKEIIPFGKYKGKPVEMLQADKGYCDWLMAQDWFRSRYGNMYTIIVNNFSEPQDTPEHNALQAKFLDDKFLDAFYDVVGIFKTSQILEECERKIESISQEIEQIYQEHKTELEGKRHDYIQSKYIDLIKNRIENKKNQVFRCKQIAGFIKKNGRIYESAFQKNGNDVQIDSMDDLYHVYRGDRLPICVQIKPCLGDDYPSVMRQILAKRNYGTDVLIYGYFTATGVTEEQMRTMIERSGIKITTFDEVYKRMPEKIATDTNVGSKEGQE